MMKVLPQNLHCIKMVRVENGKQVNVSYLTYDRYRKSFIDDRWFNERRYHWGYSIFGYVYTLNSITRPDGTIIQRRFYFPKSQDEAEQLEKQYQASLL